MKWHKKDDYSKDDNKKKNAEMTGASLHLALWVKFSEDNILKYFCYFAQKTGFDISCKLSVKFCFLGK